MNKILELLIEDFGNQKSSAEYQLVLQKFCAAEAEFMASLDKKQKVEYLKLDFICGELSLVELHEFAKFLFGNMKNHKYFY